MCPLATLLIIPNDPLLVILIPGNQVGSPRSCISSESGSDVCCHSCTAGTPTFEAHMDPLIFLEEVCTHDPHSPMCQVAMYREGVRPPVTIVSNLGLWNRNIAVESLLEEELVDRVPQ